MPFSKWLVVGCMRMRVFPADFFLEKASWHNSTSKDSNVMKKWSKAEIKFASVQTDYVKQYLNTSI